MTHKYDELDKKFKLYYIKSDKYIKDREAKLQELQDECNRRANEYGRFDENYSMEKEKGERLEAEVNEIKKTYETLKV